MSEDPSGIRAHALRYLAQRLTTAGHLRTLLLRGAAKRDPDTPRAEHQRAADAVLAELVQRGVLDDDAWIRARIDSLLRQGNAPAMIRAKLAAKRAPAALVDEALAERGADDTLRAALRLLRKRRLGPWAAEPDRQAALTRLGRAGFPYGIAERAATMPLDEAQDHLGW